MSNVINNYEIITGGVINNQTATFPAGVRAFTFKNYGTADAAITWADGSISYLRKNGDILSREYITLAIAGFSVDASGTTVDFAVIGIPKSEITYA